MPFSRCCTSVQKGRSQVKGYAKQQECYFSNPQHFVVCVPMREFLMQTLRTEKSCQVAAKIAV